MTIQFPSMKTAASAVLSVALMASATAGVSAKELRLASGVPPMHPSHNPLYTEFKDLLSEYSDGRLGGRLFGTEITTLGNMRASIRSGMVEVGLFLPIYFPADLPNVNLIGDLSLLGGDPRVTSAAVTEYMMTCQACQADFANLGIVYSGSHANPYGLLTTTPVREPEDIEGLRLRVAVPQHARWVESMGGKAVNMTTSEAFEALSQGVIEGTVTNISDIISFNLGEVISNITLVNLGTFHSMSTHSVAKKVWAGLSPEDRRALLKASLVANLRTTDRWLEIIEESKAYALDKGIALHEPSEALNERLRAFKESDLSDVAERAGERFGISDARAEIDRFRALITKWESLIANSDGSEQALAALYESEILNEIDLAAYGQ